jgi:hypothetical protein
MNEVLRNNMLLFIYLFGHIKPLTDELQSQYYDFKDKTREGLEIWLIKNSHIRLPAPPMVPPPCGGGGVCEFQ